MAEYKLSKRELQGLVDTGELVLKEDSSLDDYFVKCFSNAYKNEEPDKQFSTKLRNDGEEVIVFDPSFEEKDKIASEDYEVFFKRKYNEQGFDTDIPEEKTKLLQQYSMEMTLGSSICKYCEITKDQLRIIRKYKDVTEDKVEDQDKKIYEEIKGKIKEVNNVFDRCNKLIINHFKKEKTEKKTTTPSVTEETMTDQSKEEEPIKSETDPLKVIAKMFQDKNLRLTEAIFGKGKKRIAKWRVNLRLKGVEFNEKTGEFNESTSRTKKNEVADILVARKRTEFIKKLANLINVINSKLESNGLPISNIEKIDTTKDMNNKWFHRWTKKAVQQKVQPSKLAMFFKTHKNTKNDAIDYLASTLGITDKNAKDIANGTTELNDFLKKIGLSRKEYNEVINLKQEQQKPQSTSQVNNSQQSQNGVGGNQPSSKTSDDNTKGSDDKKIGKFEAWINQKKELKDFRNATEQKEKMQNFFKNLGYTEENLKEANIEGKEFDDLKDQLSKIIGLTTTGLQDNGKDKSNDEIIKICETRIKEINELKVLVEKAGGTAIGLPKLKKEVNDQNGSSKNDEANFHADLCNKLKTLCSKDTLENLKEFREEAKVLAKRRKFLQKQAGKGFKLEKDLTFQQLSTKLEDAIKDAKIFKQVDQQATSQGQQQ